VSEIGVFQKALERRRNVGSKLPLGELQAGEFAFEIGASEGIRTLDIHLGKVTLYQTELRSLPFRKAGQIKRQTPQYCKPSF
jgi:hypothetical protein